MQQPRIGPFWDDLISCGGLPNEGLYVNSAIQGRFVVTWLDEQIYYCTGSDTIQLTLFADGRIQFAYNGITTIAGSTSTLAIVGVTPGGDSPITQVDYVSDPSFLIDRTASVVEEFTDTANPFNLDGGFILFTPNASDGYNVQYFPPAPAGSSGANARRNASASNSQPPTVTIQGIARDAQGHPLTAVDFHVTNTLDLVYRGVTTTDQNGRYSISGVPLGGLNVEAFKQGVKVAEGGAVAKSGSLVVINLSPLSNPLETAAASMPNSAHTGSIAKEQGSSNSKAAGLSAGGKQHHASTEACLRHLRVDHSRHQSCWSGESTSQF